MAGLTVKHRIRTDKGFEVVELTPLKAIRRRCLDCCNWQSNEVLCAPSRLVRCIPIGAAAGNTRKPRRFPSRYKMTCNINSWLDMRPSDTIRP